MKGFRMICASGLVLALVPVSAAFSEGLATGAQLEELLSGNTLQGSGTENAYVEYYDTDGTLRGGNYAGMWKVDGDTACMDYGNGFSCWTAKIDGSASIWYKNGAVDAVGMKLPGNPNNF